MSTWSRSLVAVAAGVALVGVSGCAVGGSSGGASPESSTKPDSQALKKVDPCKMLSPQDLEKIGLEGSGSPKTAIPWEPGCSYDGDNVGVTVYKNMRETVQSYGKKSNWSRFERTKVNGRVAASAVDKSATQARTCTTMFNAGAGVVIVTVGDSLGKVDECAKAQEIATMIEPRMPEPA